MSRFSRGYMSHKRFKSLKFESYEIEVLAYVYREIIRYLRRYYPDYPTHLQGWDIREADRIAFHLPSKGEFSDRVFAKNLKDTMLEALEDATDGNYKEEGFKIYKKRGYLILEANQ